tara:strand:- start:4069 stop:5082 length:1014 start_codon:yes stop_codon:yes gene_type:complete
MNLRQRKIQSLKKLGKWFMNLEHNKITAELLNKIQSNNDWFTKWNLITASKAWGKALNDIDIDLWLKNYDSAKSSKKIGLILAGNIPFVGLHDVLSVWFMGYKGHVKLSSKDLYLLPLIINFLENDCPETKGQIVFINDKLENLDAVIATGSDNSARYFDYYFKNIPNIIRKNRTGVAVINGTESKEEIKSLGYDILAHYGLGCRNISKLFIPKNYDLNLIFGGLFEYSTVMDSIKYVNNYDYNKAVFLMSEFKFLDNGFFILKEDSRFSSPLASAFYTEYDTVKNLNIILEENKSRIQCIVSNENKKNHIQFGEAQNPKLYEYADGINTLDFLKKL